jgi:endonuclease/exonuclease/phosphatase family metal-dependent hydrolase
MRIMTYNVLDGGVLPDPSRLEKVLGVIRACRPDVLALQEVSLDEAESNQLVWALRKAYPYQARLTHKNFSTYADGTCLLSRIKPKSTSIAENGVPAVFMTFPGAKDNLNVCAVYLSWIDEKERLPQMQEVLRMMDKNQYGLILGDFNALSPQDGLSDDLVPGFTDRMKEKYCRDGMICYDTIRAVLDQGYIDRGILHNTPSSITRMTDVHLGAPHSRPVRIDYMFVTHDFEPYISYFELVDNEATRNASDHFPWVMDVLGDFFPE